jgi:pimeloyl-ACP methyl ester carboxylesterase
MQISEEALLEETYNGKALVQAKWVYVPVGADGNEIWRVRSYSCRLTEREAENKPVLLLVHGTASGGMMWNAVWHRLVHEFDIIALDMPGFARSPTPASLRHA